MRRLACGGGWRRGRGGEGRGGGVTRAHNAIFGRAEGSARRFNRRRAEFSAGFPRRVAMRRRDSRE